MKRWCWIHDSLFLSMSNKYKKTLDFRGINKKENVFFYINKYIFLYVCIASISNITSTASSYKVLLEKEPKVQMCSLIFSHFYTKVEERKGDGEPKMKWMKDWEYIETSWIFIPQLDSQKGSPGTKESYYCERSRL